MKDHTTEFFFLCFSLFWIILCFLLSTFLCTFLFLFNFIAFAANSIISKFYSGFILLDKFSVITNYSIIHIRSRLKSAYFWSEAVNSSLTLLKNGMKKKRIVMLFQNNQTTKISSIQCTEGAIKLLCIECVCVSLQVPRIRYISFFDCFECNQNSNMNH